MLKAGLIAFMAFTNSAIADEESVKIGKQTWMAKNLNDASKGGKCYEDKPENCEKYGRLYTWDEAMKACPTGWHLPSDKEWQTLVNFASVDGVAGGKLKAKNGWERGVCAGTDEYGFSALPGGFGVFDGDFYDAGFAGYWWTNLESSDRTKNKENIDGYQVFLYGWIYYLWAANQESVDRTKGYLMLMLCGKENVSSFFYTKTGLYSVRCLQNGETHP